VSDVGHQATPVNLAAVRDECERIFNSGDSLYPSEIEFAEAVVVLVEATEALRAIRRRIPLDAENEDANGWGRVDKALAAIDFNVVPRP
jgi:hypothetical protein